MASQIIPVEGDRCSIGILIRLVWLKGSSKCLCIHQVTAEVPEEVIQIGLQAFAPSK